MKAVLRVGLYALAGLVSLFLIASLAREMTMVSAIGRTGDIWTFFEITDSTSTVAEVDSTDFLSPPYPSAGDTLVSINGVPVSTETYFGFFNTSTEPGNEYVLRFKRPENLLGKISSPLLDVVPMSESIRAPLLGILRMEQTYTTVVRTRSIPSALLAQLLLMMLLRLLLAAAYLAVPLWAFFRRPDSRGMRILLLFCMAIVLEMVVYKGFISEHYASFDIPMHGVLAKTLGLLGLFYPAFWLNLQLVFPSPRRVMAKAPVPATLVCYLPQLAMILMQILGRPHVLGERFFPIAATVQVVLGLGLLTQRFLGSPSTLEKRQSRLVLWGAAPALLLHFLIVWLGMGRDSLLGGLSVVQRLAVSNLDFLVLLLIPLSLAYAFGRYRLMEVEGKLKRGTAFVAASALLLIAFIAALFGVGRLLLDYFGIESRTPTFVIGLGLALGFVPAQRKLRSFMQQAFYPERRRLRALLQEFLESAPSIGDRSAFWKSLEARLEDGLGCTGAYPLLLDEPGGRLLLEGETPTPFEPGSGLGAMMRAARQPLMVDEVLASGITEVPPEEEAWLRRNGIAVMLPLGYGDRMLGLLCLGRKPSQEDYEPVDLAMIRSLAPQIALAGENLRLIEDKLNRRRMEEQLRFARRIQESLLPTTLPDTGRVELAASSRSCLEVAGDYYDVLSLEDGRIAIAIGDVAGKGAGAALLMANLQASLRTAMSVGGRLDSIISTMNRQLHESTPSEMFASFFVGILDPDECVMEYVNAGHNPPVLISPGGDRTELDTGGLLLGVSRQSEYSVGQVELDSGSLLLMFTDGITEAFDENGDEFGLERLLRTVEGHREHPLEELVRSIESQVDEFRRGAPVMDDQTLVLARTSAASPGGSKPGRAAPESWRS
ncbi:SpoIIE family protein phosphatase [Candidatus Fermentibacterales bacterium]|nr:SpoIIE family protein phosphatase [Candidatus Fermentibacterales bacterium]